MWFKVMLLIGMACALPACTTVNISEMAGQSVSVRPLIADNVVERASNRLYATFMDKGWCEREANNRLQTAALMLLKGRDAAQSEDAATLYSARSNSEAEIITDIVLATDYVSQTTKAAEVYADVAPEGAKFSDELTKLERALMASRDAEGVFSAALKFHNVVETPAEFVTYSEKVNELRMVTDAFGDRVRQNKMTVNPAAS